MCHLATPGQNKGDQIERKFAQWVIVYLEQWFENYTEVAHNSGLPFSAVPAMH
jgi:hypothetical protein